MDSKMQSQSSVSHNRVRIPNGTKGKVFAFLSGVFVGTVGASLFFANYYAGIFIQESLHLEHQHDHLGQPQWHRRQGQQKKQLRNEQSSSSTIHDKTPVKVTFDKTENETRTTETAKITSSSVEIGTNESSSFRCDQEPFFFELARETGTDKVKGLAYLPSCLADDSTCTRPSCQREKCRPWGHFYQTMYQQKLNKFLDPNESFQLMEIGYVRILSHNRPRCN